MAEGKGLEKGHSLEQEAEAAVLAVQSIGSRDVCDLLLGLPQSMFEH